MHFGALGNDSEDRIISKTISMIRGSGSKFSQILLRSSSGSLLKG